MPDDLRSLISAVVTRAPQWLRQDLLSADPAARARAEDALAAMIEQAIREAVANVEQR